MAKTGKQDSTTLSASPAGTPQGAGRTSEAKELRRAKGLPVPRRVTAEGVSAQQVLEQVEWTRRPAKISGADGEVVFKMDDAEVPASWSQLATDVAVSKYFRKAGVPRDIAPTGAEWSVR